ncbi:MAG: translocation/assembly module TamB domain-containing protein [Paludibacter sp.]|nr:translocation/assembly module TamB domain-containing protein [Paludibacter sp.]
MLLQTNSIQQTITKAIVAELSDKLHSHVSVGSIRYKLFNDISMDDLYVEDQQKDTLLFVKQVDAHFDLWEFFHGKIIISSVVLDRFYGNIIIDKAGHSNLDFVINAFKKPASKDTTSVEYQVKRFKLKNSSFNFTNLNQFKPLPNGVFNGNKMKFKAINADISLDLLNKDSLSASIKSLSAVEHTGLVLTDLRTQVYGSKKGVKIPEFDVKMPNSLLHLEDIHLKYENLADLNRFLEKVRINALISNSHVAFSDLKAFVPEFKNVRGAAQITGLITGRISSLHFQNIKIRYGKSFLFHADIDINGLPDSRELFIYGQIKDLQVEKSDVQDLVSEIINKPFVLPNEVNQLGLIRYKGNITGFLNNLVVFGNLTTNVGSVSSDILLKFENRLRDLIYNGTIKSSSLQLGKLLNNKQLGIVSFNLNTIGTKKFNAKFQGTVKGKVSEFQFNNYSYRDVLLGGKYDGKGYDGTVDMTDQNLDAHFEGKIDLTQKLPVYDFGLRVKKVNLNALKLITTYQGAILSFNGNTNIIGNSLDNINGAIHFDSIRFTNQNKTLAVDNIQLISRIDAETTHFTIVSDYVNGAFSGNFKYSTVGQTIDKIVQKYLPSLANLTKNKTPDKYTNHIDMDLRIENISKISDILGLPFSLEGVSTVKGYIDERTNKMDVSANIPVFKTNKQELDNLTLHFDNPSQQLQLTSRAQLQGKDGMQNVFLRAFAARDSVTTHLGWQNAQQVTNAGEFNTVTRFKSENGKTSAQLSVFPSQIIISDTIWSIHPCKVDFKADSTIQIHNFNFDNHSQFVHINGTLSKKQTDSLNLSLNDVDLDFVMGLLKLKGIAISGVVTGKATLLSVLKQPIFEANIDVKNFQLNHKWLGNGHISSNWDKLNSQLLARGSFLNDKKDTIVVAKGVYTPKNDTIIVNFDARNFSIEFLTPYLETVVQNLKGYLSGHIRLFGALKHGISFDGDGIVNKGQVSVKMLNTTYFLQDSVHLTRNTIEFRNIRIYDQERNPASLNAMLTHNGFFQHMKFDARIAGKNMLALNTQAEDNDYFFGKAYANGSVHIYGDEREANIFVNAISQPQTKCYIQMGGTSKASNNSFINFVNKINNNSKNTTAPQKSIGKDMNVKVNLQIECTPDAEMELIVDPKGGDMISGTGNGSLRVEFDTYTDLKLYGTYTIDRGYYLFTLQNLIRKEFKIDQGSTLSWTGNPRSAQVNIRALYPLTASLKDLIDPSQLGNMRTSVPVNCVLKLTDNLMKPTIRFDIDLPQSDEGVKQIVRNTINTDEMMNRQILYLLVFNRFYTPDYMRTATTSNLGTNEALSFATSTLSAQLNNWISQTFKSNSFSLGVDYRQTDQLSSDVQAQILYQPNNRWIVNGNIGYRNDILTTNTNRFISDVDFQYLLTESGKLRFKAYNHTVDRYQLRTATQTQGVGFIYKEDFVSVKDLFGYYWRLLTAPKTKTTNEEKPAVKK